MQETTWGSHKPILQSLMRTFEVTGILELGAGKHSTPALFSECPFVVSIENDQAWINKLQNEEDIKEDDNHYFVYEELLPGIKRSTDARNVPELDKLSSLNNWTYYLNNTAINMAFIDCFSGFRLFALENLIEQPQLDIIVFHDVQMPGLRKHYLERVPNPEEFVRIVDKSYSVWTGALIKKHLWNSETEARFVEIHKDAVAAHSPTTNAGNLIELW